LCCVVAKVFSVLFIVKHVVVWLLRCSMCCLLLSTLPYGC